MPRVTSENFEAVKAFDQSYVAMFEAIENFFRFAKRNPQYAAQLEGIATFTYYANVGDVLKRRVDHEIFVVLPSEFLK